MTNIKEIKKLVRREIHDEPHLIEEVVKDGATLSVWKGDRTLPRIKMAILEMADGQLVPLRKLKDLALLLKAMGLQPAQQAEVLSLLQRVPLGERYFILTAEDFIGAPAPKWHPPKMTEVGLILFSNNFETGRLERVVIRNDLSIEAIDVGEGYKGSRR
jgi:hypothetical protein